LLLALLSIACTEGVDFNPVPQISALSPATALVGTTAVTIDVTGRNFIRSSNVEVAGAILTTTFVSPTQLTATLPPSLLASPATIAVSVSTPGPGGGISTAKTFTVLAEGAVSATANPQVATYSFSSPRAATVTIEFGPDTSYGLRTASVALPVGGGQVDILVAGMTAFTTHHLRAVVEFPDGITHLDTDHTFTTGGLPPEKVPGLSVTQPSGFTPQPGVQLVHLNTPDTGVDAVVTDLAGNIVWFHDKLLGGPFPIQFLSNGNFLAVDSIRPFGALREFDPAVRAALGAVKRYVTPAGNVRFDAERAPHADHFWALALALAAADDSSAPATDFLSSGLPRPFSQAFLF